MNKKQIEILELPLMVTSMYCLWFAGLWCGGQYLLFYSLHLYAGLDKPDLNLLPCGIAFLVSVFIVVVYNLSSKLFGGITIIVSLKEAGENPDHGVKNSSR